MSINEIIERTLSGICTDIWPDVCPEENGPDEYITYNYETQSAEVFADDVDQEWVYYLQIHYFTKGNYLEKKKEIRSALREQGFLVTDIQPMYEKDTRYYHLVFSCQIEESEE